MTFARLTAWTLLAAAGFALPGGTAAGQDKIPSSPATVDITRWRGTRGIDDLPRAKTLFAGLAKYNVEIITHPLVYKAAQDPTVKADSTGRRIPSADEAIKELDRFILEPTPNSKVGSDNADYIRELGAAFDAALKPAIDANPDRVVRINATRMLAAVCRSGATAHWPTVTGLLTNANTPTEVKYYALQAAANLLSAYDINEYRYRKHANEAKEVGALVAAVETCVKNPATLVPGFPAKSTEATSDQLAVVGYVRRQAVKALAQVRFVTIPGPDGKAPLYPATTLARVCVSDPALVPAPSPSECAEAAIGLCNMAPVVNETPIKNYNAGAAAEAVAAALVTFGEPRAEKVEDRSLPWRGYGIRLAEALKSWKPLFDPLYNPLTPNAANPNAAPAAITTLTQQAQLHIFGPLEKLGPDGKPDIVGGRLDITKMKDYLKQLREDPKRNPLMFTSEPSSTIDFTPKK